jgi:methylmalonyl-CoA carboxyltransferase small subunit
LAGIQSQRLSLDRPDNGAELRVCHSPVNGIVVRISAQAGDQLQAHDPVLVLEAMKMETSLMAPVSGRLKRVNVAPGQAVKIHQVLVEFE